MRRRVRRGPVASASAAVSSTTIVVSDSSSGRSPSQPSGSRSSCSPSCSSLAQFSSDGRRFRTPSARHTVDRPDGVAVLEGRRPAGLGAVGEGAGDDPPGAALLLNHQPPTPWQVGASRITAGQTRYVAHRSPLPPTGPPLGKCAGRARPAQESSERGDRHVGGPRCSAGRSERELGGRLPESLRTPSSGAVTRLKRDLLLGTNVHTRAWRPPAS